MIQRIEVWLAFKIYTFESVDDDGRIWCDFVPLMSKCFGNIFIAETSLTTRFWIPAYLFLHVRSALSSTLKNKK